MGIFKDQDLIDEAPNEDEEVIGDLTIDENDESEGERITDLKSHMKKYTVPWIEFPSVEILEYLPRGLRHFFFSFFPTILDIVTDILLCKQYFNGTIYSVT